MVVDESIDTFDQSAFRQRLASYLTGRGTPVTPAMISLNVTAASVMVTAIITASSATQSTTSANDASEIANELGNLSPSLASSALGVTVTKTMPPRVTAFVFDAPSPPPPPALPFCPTYKQICVDAGLSQAYTDCDSETAAMGTGTAGDTAGDSLGCRAYHLSVAATTNPGVHCLHASPDGGRTCVTRLTLASDVEAMWAVIGSQRAHITVEYQGNGWLGFGVGTGRMVGSKVVIGDASGASKYSLTGLVKPSPDATQDFVGATFTQADGVSTLTYAAPLSWLEQFAPAPEGQVTFTWARGSQDALAYHGSTKGSKTVLTIRPPRGVASPSPPMPPPLPAASPSPESVLPEVVLRYVADNGNVTVTVTYGGMGWLAFGVSSGGMVGGQVVIGAAAGNGANGALDAQMYPLTGYSKPSPDAGQYMITGATFAQRDGKSILSFTAPLSWFEQFSSAGGALNLIWATGSSNSLAYHEANRGEYTLASLPASGSGLITLGSAGASGVSRSTLVMVHAIFMLLGWGVLLPSGAFIARYCKHWGARWFKLHRGIQVVGLSCALVGFIVALTSFSPIGPTASASTHGNLGIVVMTLGLFQATNGFLRPHKPSANIAPGSLRIAWELMHRYVGRTALILAPITIILGTQLLTTTGARAAFFVLILGKPSRFKRPCLPSPCSLALHLLTCTGTLWTDSRTTCWCVACDSGNPYPSVCGHPRRDGGSAQEEQQGSGRSGEFVL